MCFNFNEDVAYHITLIGSSFANTKLSEVHLWAGLSRVFRLFGCKVDVFKEASAVNAGNISFCLSQTANSPDQMM